jgi:hypothetical protein
MYSRSVPAEAERAARLAHLGELKLEQARLLRGVQRMNKAASTLHPCGDLPAGLDVERQMEKEAATKQAWLLARAAASSWKADHALSGVDGLLIHVLLTFFLGCLFRCLPYCPYLKLCCVSANALMTHRTVHSGVQPTEVVLRSEVLKAAESRAYKEHRLQQRTNREMLVQSDRLGTLDAVDVGAAVLRRDDATLEWRTLRSALQDLQRQKRTLSPEGMACSLFDIHPPVGFDMTDSVYCAQLS